MEPAGALLRVLLGVCLLQVLATLSKLSKHSTTNASAPPVQTFVSQWLLVLIKSG